MAEAAKKHGRRIALIPAGERWPDGSLRPSFEDLVGAGAISSYLNGNCSPEAQAAKSAFLAAEQDLKNLLLQCGSGKELVERGYKEDANPPLIERLALVSPPYKGAYTAQ